MRLLLSFTAAILLAPFTAVAQDPGAQAAQMAAQQAQIANEQAMQQSQMASQQAMQNMQQAQQTAAATSGPCCYGLTALPKFSVKPGTYTAPTTVKISDASRGAVIYYTTDGWTPTPTSLRYRGPITIDSTTTLQAVAVSPYSVRSLVAVGHYDIATTPPAASVSAPIAPPPGVAANPNGPVPVKLEFGADVNSQTASIGDKIPMTLAEDLVLGNTVVKKGAVATVTITAVDKKSFGGLPGVLTFEADSLQSAGGSIPLVGGATREGMAKPPNAAFLIPVVGPFTILKHGDPAIISKGTSFMAYVDPNTVSALAQ
jgi:Chitobiase/beta-hexosaminidase C-terminal domain